MVTEVSRMKSRRYSRKNQLDDTTLIVGGVLGVAVIGGIIYFATRPSSTVSASAPAIASSADPTSAQLGVPAGLTQQQAANYLSGDLS
jgi:hypothetical protein